MSAYYTQELYTIIICLNIVERKLKSKFQNNFLTDTL